MLSKMFMGWLTLPMPLDLGQLCRQIPEKSTEIFDSFVTRHDRAAVLMAVKEASGNLPQRDGH